MKYKIKRKASSLAIGFTATALLLGATGAAQADYPERPIGVMVAYNPGGATDFQARIATLASAKEKDGKPISVGQPIYVTNKPSAM